MSTIFISHSSQDKEAADTLKAKLAQCGFADGDLFLDFDVDSGIRSGEEWEGKLYLELRRCKALIVLCSQASMSSPWCFAEIAQAKAAGKHVFPIKVADYDEKLPAHRLIDRFQAIDVRTAGDTGYERLLKGLNLAGLDPNDSFNLGRGRAPYPGMFAFEETDAAIYFGRNPEIDAILDRLARMRMRRDAPFAIIHGGSGCGKSSLLRAGVIPRLKKDRERWVIIPPFRPHEQPLEELARALAQALHDHGKDIDWKEIRDRLATEQNVAAAALSELAKDLTMAAGKPEANVLLVVDQFEEVFDQRAAADAERLLSLLGGVLKQPGSPVLTLITMRSEFLGLLQNRAELQGVSFEGIPLGPMAREHLLEAITGPAGVANIQIDDGLGDRIVQDIETEDALPLLAFTLRQLHEACRERSRFTLDAYQTLGGVKGAVQKVIESAGADKSGSAEEERAVRLAFLCHLVALNDEGQFTRREALWDNLPTAAHPVFEKLVDARLLVTSEREKQRTVEVAHEALFRVWPKLAGWLEKDREFQLWKKRFAGWCRDWIAAEHARGLLLRSRPLRESRERLREAADRFDPEEAKFIRKSVAHRRLAWGGTVFAVAALLAVASILPYRAWRESRARDLTNRAIATLDVDPQRSLELAAAAVSERPIKDAWEGLRRALLASHVRAVLPPPGHTEGVLDSVDDASFSPDGRFIVTAGTVGNDRGAAHIWEVGSAGPVSVSHQTNDATGSRPPTLVKSLPHDKPVQAAAFSPNGALVATASGETVHVWDTTNWKQLGAPVTHQGMVSDIAFGCDSESLASVSSDGRLRLMRTRSGDVQELPAASNGKEPAPVNAVAFSDDCKWIVTASDDGTARVWEVATRRQITAFEAQRKLADASFSPDGRQIVTAGWDNNARVWDMGSDGGTPRELLHRAAVHRAVFSPDGTRVATASDDGTGRLLVREGARDEIAVLANLQTSPLRSVVFSPRGQWLLTAGEDTSAQLWSAWSGKPVAVLRGHRPTHAIKAIAFSRDGTRIVTAGQDGTARVWEAEPDTGEFPALVHPAEVRSATVHPSGDLVVTASSDGNVRVWEVGAEAPTAVLKGHGQGALSAVLSADGKFLITASEDTTARVWQWDGNRAWNQVGGPLPHPDPVWRGAISVDGKLALTACADGSARLWRRDEDGTAWRSSRREHPAPIVSIALSPDEQCFVTASVDGKARVWKVNENSTPVELPGEKPLYDAAFSPDGSLVVTAGEDKRAQIWKWNEVPPELVLEIEHDAAVLSAAFSPDGRFVITAAGDGMARIWHARTGEPLNPLPDRDGPVYDAQFSPNGKLLVVAGGDQRALAYRWERFAPPQDLLREVEARRVQ